MADPAARPSAVRAALVYVRTKRVDSTGSTCRPKWSMSHVAVMVWGMAQRYGAIVASITTVIAALAVAATSLLTGSPLATAVGPPAVAASESVLLQPVQYVDVPGARLGYREAGQGRPLVLIVGFAVTMSEWEKGFVDELARHHRVILFDNRAVGTSTGSVRRLSVAQMARDTAAFIDKVVGGPADVLGWSMGGFIAQELAITSPSSVRRLVLTSTNCGGPDSEQISAPVLAILSSPTATTEQRLGILFPPNRMADGEAWVASIGATFAANNYLPADSLIVPPATEQAQIRAIGPDWYGRGDGTCERLGQIAAPTLVAAGRQDEVIPSVNHRALVRGIPDATSRVYSDAGHAFLFQPGLRFARTVDRFLRSQ